MSSPTLMIGKHECVAILTLNRPETMNALSVELRRALVEAFDSLRDDAERPVRREHLHAEGLGDAFIE